MAIIIHTDDGREIELCARKQPKVPTSGLTDEPKPKAKPVAQQREMKKADVTPLEATLILARKGNTKVLPLLRRALDEHPELWQHYGNLALQSQESWLKLIAGKDLLLAETMRRHLDAMRTELAGPNPKPLDRLLVDRILACHVQVLYFEAAETSDPTAENMRLARYRLDRRDQAHRQFLAAVKTLATVRNLVARTNVIQVELLHPPAAQMSSEPIVHGANGEQPVGAGQHLRQAPVNGAAKPINRVNGAMNGHRSRFGHNPAEPISAK